MAKWFKGRGKKRRGGGATPRPLHRSYLSIFIWGVGGQVRSKAEGGRGAEGGLKGGGNDYVTRWGNQVKRGLFRGGQSSGLVGRGDFR